MRLHHSVRYGAVLCGVVLMPACSAIVQPNPARLYADDGGTGGGGSDGGTGGSDAGDAGGCAAGLVACGGGCVDLASDPSHCGSCGTICPAAQTCSLGRCVCTTASCMTGFTGIGDPANCGASHSVCSADQVCLDGTCQCRPPLRSVAGACVDLSTDPNNCGMIGRSCPIACFGGFCVRGCPPPTIDCSGACVDTRTDPTNCGGCGNGCSASQVCIAGNCRDYLPTGGCTTCPCPTCVGDFATCCTYPRTASAICVDTGRCF